MHSNLTHDQQLAADIAWLARREREAAAAPLRPRPACGQCQHFTPDPINPPAGMGRCGRGHGSWHAGAVRSCGDYTARKTEA